MTCRGLFGLYLIATATMLVQAEESSSFANRVIDEATLGLVRGGESNSFATCYGFLSLHWRICSNATTD